MIGPKTFVCPAVVTFERLGDNQFFYEWLAERCKEEKLLGQSAVAEPVVLSVHEYEKLMALAADGRDMVAFLRTRSRDPHRRRMRIAVDLYNLRATVPRPAELDCYFDEITSRMQAALFQA